MSKLIMVDGVPIKYQIWDTAGQEKYHSLAPMYYRGAAAAIIVYDITRASSFQTLKSWVRELQTLGPENIVIAICGNKSDLEDKRVRVCTASMTLCTVVRLDGGPQPSRRTLHHIATRLHNSTSHMLKVHFPPTRRRLMGGRLALMLRRSAHCF